jgi:hypothetical protein
MTATPVPEKTPDEETRFSASVQQSASLAPSTVEGIGVTGKVPGEMKAPKARRPRPEERSGPVITVTQQTRDMMLAKANSIVDDKTNSYTRVIIEHDTVVVR